MRRSPPARTPPACLRPPATCTSCIAAGVLGGAAHPGHVTFAVKIARQLPGTPVKLIWSREEDMLHGHYHPLTQCKLTAGLDENGTVVGFHMRISGQSILKEIAPQRLVNGVDLLAFQGLMPSGEYSIAYDFPNLLIEHAVRQPPIPPGILARRERQSKRTLHGMFHR